MNHINPTIDTRFRNYVELQLRRHLLLAEGKEDGPEIAEVEDSLGEIWDQLDEAQRQGVKGVGSDLNWVRRKGGAPPKGKAPTEITPNDKRGLDEARTAKDWHRTLLYLRICSPILTTEELASLRADAYAAIGLSDIEKTFREFAKSIEAKQPRKQGENVDVAKNETPVIPTFLDEPAEPAEAITKLATHLPQVSPKAGEFYLPFETFPSNQFDVSWAGPYPLGTGFSFCLGSKDGRVLFTDANGDTLDSTGSKGSISGTSINGIAGWRNWIAVATRSEVGFVKITPSERGIDTIAYVYQASARGVISTASGYFMAPLGPDGLMIADPKTLGEPSVTANDSVDKMDCNKVICLRSADGQEVIACANRFSGVAVAPFVGNQEKIQLQTIGFNSLDIIDICPLNWGPNPLAAVALATDGKLFFFTDILKDKRPKQMKFNRVKGIASRLLSSRGHLFVMTDMGFYVLANLAANFSLNLLESGKVTQILEQTMSSVDISIVHEQWLLVVMTDGVRKYDLNIIDKNVPEPIPEQRTNEAYKQIDTESLPSDQDQAAIAHRLKVPDLTTNYRRILAKAS